MLRTLGSSGVLPFIREHEIDLLFMNSLLKFSEKIPLKLCCIKK